MPEHLTPGIYVEEFETGARPIEGVSTSTAGFLGLTERGPTETPGLVTSFMDFTNRFGAFQRGMYLPSAVEGFFDNGGQRCFIGRIVRQDATRAGLTQGNVTITAVGEGEWGNRVGIRIENAPDDPHNKKPDGKRTFNLTIAYWKKEIPPDFSIPQDPRERARRENEILDPKILGRMEVFDNLSEDTGSPENYLKRVGDPKNNLSFLVVLSGSGRPPNTDPSTFFVPLVGGSDGTDPLSVTDFQGDPGASPGERRGLTAFTDIDEISIVAIPDTHHLSDKQTLNDHLLTHCETRKDRFAIIDAARNSTSIGSLNIEAVARQSRYGAIYYPWIKVYDPETWRLELQPPCGHIAGIYARSDTERGVHKAPAYEKVRGAPDLEFTITKGEQDILNPRGINVIRKLPKRGILVWGARTCILDPLWKYINVRRLFIYLEESIKQGTQWVVFEPNNEKLWARVVQTITQFLTTVWKDGMLMGTKPEQAFFVRCDRSTMTQEDIDEGRLICVIGIAPVKPAEFVIFRLAQWQGGSAVTEPG